MQRVCRTIIAAVGTLALLGAGCSQQTVSSASHDAQHNVTVLDQKADQLAKQAKPQLRKLDTGGRVTAAITANQNLRGTAIRVDADTDGVRLRGTVSTPEQKRLAGRVAQDTLGSGQTVFNELAVQGQ